jgi:hypothetical protein
VVSVQALAQVIRLVIPRPPEIDTPAPGPLFTPPLKYYRVLQLTAISTIENVRFRGLFFFWIDGKRSIFIINFLDRFQGKAGWKAWKGNRLSQNQYLLGVEVRCSTFADWV